MKFILCAMLFLGLIAFVIVSPDIDQSLSIIPYNSNITRFYGETHLWCSIVYYSVPVITTLCVLIPLWYLFKSRSMENPKKTRAAALIVVLSLAIGPGLIVNTVFKNNWGRPRPYQVIRDGKTFSPVYKPNFNQPKNNSFPCGHASIGFFLGVPLLARGFRRKGLIISAVAGSFIGFVRMLQGGHYLSDVIFSGVLVWLAAELVTYIVNRVMGVTRGG